MVLLSKIPKTFWKEFNGGSSVVTSVSPLLFHSSCCLLITHVHIDDLPVLQQGLDQRNQVVGITEMFGPCNYLFQKFICVGSYLFHNAWPEKSEYSNCSTKAFKNYINAYDTNCFMTAYSVSWHLLGYHYKIYIKYDQVKL